MTKRRRRAQRLPRVSDLALHVGEVVLERRRVVQNYRFVGLVLDLAVLGLGLSTISLGFRMSFFSSIDLADRVTISLLGFIKSSSRSFGLLCSIFMAFLRGL